MGINRASEAAVQGLRFLANPVQKFASKIYTIVILRVVTLLLIFASMVILTLAILLRPWKLNIYRGDQMEIGVWTICRVTKKFYQCYDDWYEEHYQHWLMSWRYLMVTAIVVLFLTYCYLCFQVFRKKDLEEIPWIRGSIGCCFAGICNFIAFILFYHKFEWEFAEENFGWPIMGWNEETPDAEGFIETTGAPYIMAWVSEVLTFIAAYMCFYTKCQEGVYIRETTKKQQQFEMMRKIVEETTM